MRRFLLFIPVLTLFLAACTNNSEGGPYLAVQGFTQGTTYHMTYQSKDTLNLAVPIDSILHAFDMSLSTWIPESIISRVNANEDPEVDEMFATVYRESDRVNKISDGAFDITVGPVIDAWGFGPGQKVAVDSAVIDSLLQFVGMDKVSLENGHVYKKLPQIRLDVNAIAQGYSVDVVCAYFDRLKITNYMVEIGGELRVKGLNPRGVMWKIGIDRPDFGNEIPGEHLQNELNLTNHALATSGNYRKFFEENGVKFTHSINPKTGYPERDRLLSASVITKDCITADAYATVCMVLGLDKAKEFIEAQPGTEAYFIFSDDNGNYQEWYTGGLKNYLEEVK